MATNLQRIKNLPEKLVNNWNCSMCVMELLGFKCTKADVKDRCPLEEQGCNNSLILEWLQEECDE